MKAKWSIIPDINEIKKFVTFAEKYNAAFEYNDFFEPFVYEDSAEVERRISLYKDLDRDRSADTLHGVFYDISVLSRDTVIRERSRDLVKASLDAAMRLSCRGVVFHTGMVFGLETKQYIDSWLGGMDEFLHEIAPQYKDLDIYIENTFEKSPAILTSLMERVSDLENTGICLDYAHAMLTGTEGEAWFTALLGYIRHMHLNDHDLKADLHLATGDGKIDLVHFKHLMEKYDVTGPRILLEVNGYDKASRSLEYMDKI